jgi:hypothetical protein
MSSPTTLHGLTLTVPWGTLSVAPVITTAPLEAIGFLDATIGVPLKLHETRGYRLKDAPRRLLIHNGKGDAGFRESIVERRDNAWRFIQPYAAALRACGYSDLDPWYPNYEERVRSEGPLNVIRLGYVQGLVTVTRCISTTDPEHGPAHELDRALGNWQPKRFGWRMEDQWVVPRPFHARGMQAVWHVPEYIQAMLRERGAAI